MRRRAALLILLFSLLLAASAQDSSSKPATADRVVFAVFDSSSVRGTQPGTRAEPMMLVQGNDYLKPPVCEHPDSSVAQPLIDFGKTYLSPHTEYLLYFGGKRAGTVNIQKSDVDCISAVATVTMTGLPPLRTANFALAVAGEAPASHANERRFANPAELQTMMTYAQKAFEAYGVGRHLSGKAEAISVVVTDLDRDGQNEMVASYKLAGAGATHRLFLILYNNGDGTYQPLVSEYNVAGDPDMKDYKEETFVDQIDLDGDGMDEVFTRSNYYESWDYSMYKKGPNGWRKVYTGGGGGS